MEGEDEKTVLDRLGHEDIFQDFFLDKHEQSQEDIISGVFFSFLALR